MSRPPLPRHPVTQPLDPSYRLIALTQGQNAIVDTEDFAKLSEWTWFAMWSDTTNSFYACSNEWNPVTKKSKVIHMHRLIMQPFGKEICDHRDHDTLNNRKTNLRKCSYAQNLHNVKKHTDNKSGFKGVSWHKSNALYRARIMLNGKDILLGYFKSPHEAARAYDEAAKKLHGEFAFINHSS